jgi:hypothetical protein
LRDKIARKKGEMRASNMVARGQLAGRQAPFGQYAVRKMTSNIEVQDSSALAANR